MKLFAPLARILACGATLGLLVAPVAMAERGGDRHYRHHGQGQHAQSHRGHRGYAPHHRGNARVQHRNYHGRHHNRGHGYNQRRHHQNHGYHYNNHRAYGNRHQRRHHQVRRQYHAPAYRHVAPRPVYHNYQQTYSYAPSYGYTSYSIGGTYTYNPRSVVVGNYHTYGLQAPPHGYHWVCDDGRGDAILASVATGAIIGLAVGVLGH